DLHLAASATAAIDRGATVSSVTNDWDGQTRPIGHAYDIGADEYSGDAVPPSVSITTPGNGATVSGTITVSANASDNLGVAGVQFKLDGANVGAEVTTAPYSISWNTTSASNATHTLTAVARDSGGNRTTSAAVTVTVNNGDTTPPTVSITSPAGGAV